MEKREVYQFREFSPAFSKSRNRLIYFSAAGCVSLLFPLAKESTLFGLRFDNLDAEGLTFLIFVVCTVIAILDYIPRAVEEVGALSGFDPSIHTRLAEKHDEFEIAISRLGDLERKIAQLQESTEQRLEAHDAAASKYADIVDTKAVSQAFRNLSAARERLFNMTEELLNEIQYIRPEFDRVKPDSLWVARANQIRAYIEFLGGPAIFISFCAIYFDVLYFQKP